jgi:ABC-type transporter Mla subunit MlaD
MQKNPLTRGRIAFVLSLVLILAAALAWHFVAGSRLVPYEIRTRDPVSGLIAGAPVEFHGVEVGKVRAVRLLDPRTVSVVLEVRRDAPVTSATVATVTGRGLAARGFTGYVYVSLEDRGPAGRPLAATGSNRIALIAAAPPQTASLDTSFAELNQNVKEVTGLLQQVLDRNTIASLKTSIAELEKVSRTLAANNTRIETILTNAEQATGRMQPLLRTSSEVLRSLQGQILPEAQRTLVQLEDLSVSTRRRLDVVLDNTEQASTRLAPLLQSGTDTVHALQTQLLPEAQRTLVRMEHLSTTLDDTAVRIRRNPAVLLRGTAPVAAGPGEGQ